MRRLRWLLVFGLLVSPTLPSEAAAKRLTVAQLEQSLASDVAGGKRDSEIAGRLANIALSERIPQAAFASLIAQFRSSPQTSLALATIANQSEFLDPPASEIVGNAVPDNAAQANMLQNARRYVAETLRGLPNFLATRTINLYDDRPQPPKDGGWPVRSGLHLAGTSHAEISVGRERDDQPPTRSSAVWQSRIGLVSGGEFGNTLGMVLEEAAAGDTIWSHWERSPTGVLAVFRYSVPAPASHFEVISTFQREAGVGGTRSAPDARGVSGIELRPNISSSNVEVVQTRPAYHGSIWLDPADGTIYRITMEADMNKALPFRRAAILVEYGPVEISGARFTCPLRSLAISEAQATAETIAGSAVTQWLNETVFTDYHRFGSTSRILNEAASASAADSAPTAVSNQLSPALQQASPAAAASANPSVAVEAPSPNAPEREGPGPGSSTLNASSPPAKAADIPPSPSQPAAGDTGFKLQLDVSSLLVPAVVLDKGGQSVGGLTKEDFVILDDGKPRPITGFTLVQRTQANRSQRGQTPAPERTQQDVSQSTPNRRRFIIFLFDDRHMTADELPRVQTAANRLLDQPLADDNYAAVVSFMGANSGITRDNAALKAAIAKLTLHHALQHDREDCPDVDYYSADQIIHQHNAMEFQIAVEKARQCSSLQAELSREDPYTGISNPNDPFQRAAMSAATRALAIGEEDARQSLASVKTVVHAMSKLSGERVLILVSSGFLSLSPETMKLKSEIMDVAAASEVVVNALDARGLYAANLDASQGGSTSTIGLVTDQQGQNHLASMQAGENAMSELAVGTGGQFLHNNNDLQAGFEMLAAVPENSYLLEVSLKDVKPNGAFHRLQVKLVKPGFEIRARNGYVAPKLASGKN